MQGQTQPFFFPAVAVDELGHTESALVVSGDRTVLAVLEKNKVLSNFTKLMIKQVCIILAFLSPNLSKTKKGLPSQMPLRQRAYLPP